MSNLVKTNHSLTSSPFGNGFSDILERFFGEQPEESSGNSLGFIPQADVVETEKAYEIRLAVPGMDKKNFSVDLQDGILSISGERTQKQKSEKAGYHRSEIRYGSFRRSFRLPDDVVSDKIAASYQDGILEIVLPKDEQKNRKVSVSVQ